MSAPFAITCENLKHFLGRLEVNLKFLGLLWHWSLVFSLVVENIRVAIDQGNGLLGACAAEFFLTFTPPTALRSRKRHLSGSVPCATSRNRSKASRQRSSVRNDRPAGPLLNQLGGWFHKPSAKLSAKSELAGAIRYAMSRGPALLRIATTALWKSTATPPRARCVRWPLDKRI